MPSLPITVDSALGPSALTFASMKGREALGEPFEYVVDLVSSDANLKLSELLGQPMALHLELGEGEPRHFHGIVTSAEYVETGRPGAGYRATLRPWLWLLTQTTNCRIFQNKSVPEIVEQIFRDRGFSDFEESLSESYGKSDYVVQYRESDFNFVSRLLEQSGIYYFFRHTASAHTLVLADGPGAHQAVPGCEELPYYSPDGHRDKMQEQVDHWKLTTCMTPGSVALRDYDFERPSALLAVQSIAPKDHAHGDYEVYDYPGDYRRRADGETLARIRLEQRQEGYEERRGHTNARAFTLGALFELTDHPRDDQNRQYLITRAALAMTGPDPVSGSPDDEQVFSCDFAAIDSDVPFRKEPTARKPVVEGPQTAVVVGQQGQEIWTDVYGRVKVQFYWDREGELDENSSCWVRVAQVWAGSNWGAMHVPRIGQEVIVDFLEGDPDRPIVTGRVYNANNMPPWALPGNATQSGIKSRSSKGGSIPNANEIRFEDRMGDEELYLQAEKDMNTLVKNDQSATIQRNRTLTVGGFEVVNVALARTTQVGAIDALSVGIDATTSIGVNQTTRVGQDSDTTIGGDRTSNVGGSSDDTVAGNFVQAIQGSRTETVDGDLTLTVTGQVNEATHGAHTATFDDNFIAKHAGHRVVAVGGPAGPTSTFLQVTGTGDVSTTGPIHVVSLKGFTVTCGKSEIRVMPDQLTIWTPTAAVNGDEITIDTTSMNVVATGALVLGGDKTTLTSSGASAALDSNATVQGGAVKLEGGSGASPKKGPDVKVSYVLRVVDENERPLKGVSVSMTTPLGTTTLKTDGSGMVRVDDAPTGSASATLVSASEVRAALKGAELRPRRGSVFPEGDDYTVQTMKTLGGAVTLTGESAHTLMIATRVDVYQVGHTHLGALSLDADGPSTLAPGGGYLQLHADGSGHKATVRGEPADAPPAPGTSSSDKSPKWADTDVDALHDAVFSGDVESMLDYLKKLPGDPGDDGGGGSSP
jgi:type VI secretion system secreted protein VgrG